MLFHKKKRRKNKKDESNLEAKLLSLTTSVKVVWFILLNACGWIWCSYLLAYLGRTQIAEDLSKVALTTIVVVILGYYGKALTENLSKHNAWPDKPVSNTTEETVSVEEPTTTKHQDCDPMF